MLSHLDSSAREKTTCGIGHLLRTKKTEDRPKVDRSSTLILLIKHDQTIHLRDSREFLSLGRKKKNDMVKGAMPHWNSLHPFRNHIQQPFEYDVQNPLKSSKD